MLWNNCCEKCGGTFLSGPEPPEKCPLCERIAKKEKRDDDCALTAAPSAAVQAK